MKGLIIKDFSYFLKDMKIILIAHILYTILWISTGMKNNMLIIIAMIVTFSNILNGFSYDDKSNWNRYAMTMSLSIRDLVVSKYIFAFGIICLTAISSTVISNIISYAFKGNVMVTYKSVIIYSVIGFLYISLMFPMLFKMKYELAMTRILMILIGVPAALFIFNKLLPNVSTNIVNTFNSMNGMMTIALGMILIFLIFLISMMVSTNIMEKKEF